MAEIGSDFDDMAAFSLRPIITVFVRVLDFLSGWPKESSPRLSKLSPVPLKLGVPKSSGSLDAQDFCVPGLYSSFPEPWRSVTMRSHLTLSNLSFDPSGQLTCTASISGWSPKPKWTRTSFALR